MSVSAHQGYDEHVHFFMLLGAYELVRFRPKNILEARASPVSLFGEKGIA